MIGVLEMVRYKKSRGVATIGKGERLETLKIVAFVVKQVSFLYLFKTYVHHRFDLPRIDKSKERVGNFSKINKGGGGGIHV